MPVESAHHEADDLSIHTITIRRLAARKMRTHMLQRANPFYPLL